jgi:hypothetical protein
MKDAWIGLTSTGIAAYIQTKIGIESWCKRVNDCGQVSIGGVNQNQSNIVCYNMLGLKFEFSYLQHLILLLFFSNVQSG